MRFRKICTGFLAMNYSIYRTLTRTDHMSWMLKCKDGNFGSKFRIHKMEPWLYPDNKMALKKPRRFPNVVVLEFKRNLWLFLGQESDADRETRLSLSKYWMFIENDVYSLKRIRCRQRTTAMSWQVSDDLTIAELTRNNVTWLLQSRNWSRSGTPECDLSSSSHFM